MARAQQSATSDQELTTRDESKRSEDPASAGQPVTSNQQPENGRLSKLSAAGSGNFLWKVLSFLWRVAFAGNGGRSFCGRRAEGARANAD
ncbi:MAG: hypothetical protein ACRENG_02540 [bacterium]